ncbi:MAG: hypothetical protein EA401_14395 [Planctomycetota bacterium]|nr:MAG: hypothetical protein EA401_14395 [Planctomycetota bacterium]
MSDCRTVFAQLLQARCPQGFAWLNEQAAAVAAATPRAIATGIALTPRFTGKADLEPSEGEMARVNELVPGLDLRFWSVDQLARCYLLLHVPADSAHAFTASLDGLFRTSDVAEGVALYQGLACYPFAHALVARAREGLRSNQKALVAAVALGNPFPARHFDEEAWNQMLLKCLFVGLPLHRVQGVDHRCNRALSVMLSDYARERRAAQRPIPHDLWRVAAPRLPDERLEDIERTLVGVAGDDPRAIATAALGLANNPAPRAQALMARFPHLQHAINNGELTWHAIEEA